MDFFKESLLEKKYWQLINKVLQNGSQWMRNRLGPDASYFIAILAFFSMIGWFVLIAIGLLPKTSFVIWLFSFIVSLAVLFVIFGIFLMAVCACATESS